VSEDFERRKNLSEEYDLKKSESKIGQLYPVLVSKDGKTIDGFHRKAADENWKELVVPEIDNEEKLLIARLIANWHRRPIEREEKEKWINDLAQVYQKQGLKVKPANGSDHENEILAKIVEVTGLSISTAREYLSSDFKQPEPKKATAARWASSDITGQAEAKLGTDNLEKLKKQILKEDKLSPQKKAALTRKRQQEKEEKARQKEEARRKREAEKAEKKRLADIERKRREEEDRKREEERKRKEAEKQKKREEEIRKKAEEEAKEKLIHDRSFITAAAKLAPQFDQKPDKPPFEIPPVEEQLDKIFGAMATATSKSKPSKGKPAKPPTVEDYVPFIKQYISKKKIACPICGETKLQWSCGHDF